MLLQVLIAVQREWSCRLEALSGQEFAVSAWKALRDHVLGTLWACRHAGLVSSSFLVSVQRADELWRPAAGWPSLRRPAGCRASCAWQPLRGPTHGAWAR